MVWVDAPRVPAAEAFQKAYPDIQIEINAIPGNVGSTDLQQKFALFNQAGSGWPDAIFFPSNDDIAWATSAKINYARDLSVAARGLPHGLHGSQQRAVQHRRPGPLRPQRLGA